MQDVQPAETLGGLGKRRLDLRPLANVAVDEVCIAVRIADAGARRLRGGFAVRLVDFGNDDPGAFLRETLGGGAADAVSTAGNKCDFARQPRHGRTLTMILGGAMYARCQPVLAYRACIAAR